MFEKTKHSAVGDKEPITLPSASRAMRNVPAASSAHCTAQVVLGDGVGQRVQAESWLELSALFVLNAIPNVVAIEEQVRFFYGWKPEEQRQHVFDIIATLLDGRKIGFTVKPEARLVSGRFLEEMQEVSWWAVETGFVDEVRLITERDIDNIDLRNAQVLAAVREADPEADALALSFIDGLPEGAGQSLRRLTIDIGMQGRGYRALLRLIRNGMLRPMSRGLIGPEMVVARTEARTRDLTAGDTQVASADELIAA